MVMQLTLDSEEAQALACELAALTGESLTAVVIAALRQRLDHERTERDKQERLTRITALAADIRAHMTGRAGGRDPDRFGERDAARTPEASVLWDWTPKG